MMNRRARQIPVLLMVVASLFAAACGGTPRTQGELRFVTDSFVVRISPETRPTRALEPIYWRVVVHDRQSGAPIQGGQGRVFATSKDRKSIANGLEETGELGTYRTNLMFVTAGMWAMALEFRKDSTLALQRTQDWTQDILSADEPGDFTTPTSSTPDTSKLRVVDSTKPPARDTTKRKEP